MDESKRNHNNELYDWWSAEGDHKLIKITCPSRRAIAMANQWHEYFLWRPIAEKVHPVPRKGEYTAARAKAWSKYGFYEVFFNQLITPYAGWGRDIDRFSDADIYEDVVSFTIMYERVVDTPQLKELGTLQDECEELVRNLWSFYFDIEEAEEKLRAFLPFGKAEARQKKEEAERKIPPLREQIDKLLARVNEIRSIVLSV